jgi:hypothetical protein
MIHRFCISHKTPLLPESWYDDCIPVGDFQRDSAFHVSQFDRFWHEARPFAYSSAGAYVLPIALERFAKDATLIEISTCRKRILPSPEGIESEFPPLRELSLENFEKEAELAVYMPRPDLEFLVAPPVYIENSVIGNYVEDNRRRDILDYTAIAVEVGVLDSNSASEFLAAKHLNHGGLELGIYPKPWLIDALSRIELVGRQFLHRYSSRLEKYDSYRIRTLQFLSERLGCFLLIRHLMEKYSNNIPADIFGHTIVIVEGDSKYSVGLGDRPGNRWRWWHPKILSGYNRA